MCEDQYKYPACVQTENNTTDSMEECAQQGDIRAQVYLAWAYAQGTEFTRRDPQKSFFWGKEAADQGCPVAQRIIGDSYYFGDGVDPSISSAIEWWRLAADQKEPEALCRLGHIYFTGESNEPMDLRKAYDYMEKSEKLGSNSCIHNLSQIYFYGEVIPKDATKAKKLIEKAIELGLPQAEKIKGDFINYENQISAQGDTTN